MRYKKVPEGWRRLYLGEVVSLQGGFSFKSSSFSEDGKIPVVRMSNLKDGSLNLSEAVRVSEITEETEKFLLSEGDLLIGMSGSIDNYAIVSPNDLPCLLNQRVGRFLIKDPNRISFDYLRQLVRTNSFRNQVKILAEGAAQLNISSGDIETVDIELPPLSEQSKIAEILSSVDAVIEKTKNIIDQTQILKKGLMQELFTRGLPGRYKKFKKTEIGEISEEWEIVKLRMLASIRYGLGQPPQISVNGIPMIRATDIKQGRINVSNVMRVEKSTIPKSKDVYLKSGDVLIVRSGVYTGDVGYINQTLDGFIAGYDLIVRPSRSLNGKYLFYYLLSPMVQEGHFKNNKSRSAQPHLNAKEVGLTKIILPSIFEQERIAEILTSIDDRIEIEINRISQLLTLKSALMQVLLTGEVQVKV